jgi:hypothetical protein
MTATNSVAEQERKRREPPARLPGARQPASPADCYAVEPGEDWPEYWDPDLPGCLAAMERALLLSLSGPPQKVTRHQPGRSPKTFRRYRAGTEIRTV